MDVQGLSKEKLTIKPQKILIIGTLGSGKTTIAELLAQDTGFPYASIDDCRIRYGDGTISGEERAGDHFLALCSASTPGILEFSGMDWLSGNQYDIPPGFYTSQMWLDCRSQPAFGPVTLHSFTNCFSGCHGKPGLLRFIIW